MKGLIAVVLFLGLSVLQGSCGTVEEAKADVLKARVALESAEKKLTALLADEPMIIVLRRQAAFELLKRLEGDPSQKEAVAALRLALLIYPDPECPYDPTKQ